MCALCDCKVIDTVQSSGTKRIICVNLLLQKLFLMFIKVFVWIVFIDKMKINEIWLEKSLTKLSKTFILIFRTDLNNSS